MTTEAVAPEDLAPLFDEGGAPPAVLSDMTLELGAGIVARVLESSFASEVDSPWAKLVHARLHHPAGTRFQGFAELHVVEAPPTGWEILSRWARMTANQVKHGDRKASRHYARSLARLSAKIDTELNRLANHPAYTGAAVLGLEPMILPAFRVRSDDRTLEGEDLPLRAAAPTPNLAIKAAGWEMGSVVAGTMRPYWCKVRGETYTVWLWEPDQPEPPQ